MKDIVKSCVFFKNLSDEDIAKILNISHKIVLDHNEILFTEGSLALNLFIVLSGKMKVFKISPSGKEQILHIMTPGDIVAEAPMFAGLDYPANAQCIEKCTLLAIDREGFKNLIINNPNLTMNILSAVSFRLRNFTSLIEALSLKEVSGRLASYLLYQKEIQKSSKIELPLTRTELSKYFGTMPETLSRVFTKFQNLNIISTNNKTVTILDEEGLKKQAWGT
ncbi:transcriptional regulator, Crp/Fnr family [Thermodesulfobium narugense DSM 14796]|uniref:Transcriptional regulator, Crp/Fnr family n=1 Tax=Thermodesulfobium narugense DSM 14796 TaxID=747365 RepID=M1E5N5_9BACT|nr:Crp/Fnr family transcriptional regulator [Thermodesulfobium narugense]AEE15197.1 transcriptional regulator, Crp/Fnr family [Thermodesulfobium narugense DSM 14796]